MVQNSTRNKRIIAFIGLLAIVVIIGVGTVITGKDEKSSDSSTTDSSQSQSGQTADNSTSETSPDSTTTYRDGTYTATGSYSNPGGTSDLKVQVIVKDGIVTDSTVTPEASDNESREYQERFASGYKQYVIGKAIDKIAVSRVSGSSLTSQGFNEALERIKDQANA